MGSSPLYNLCIECSLKNVFPYEIENIDVVNLGVSIKSNYIMKIIFSFINKRRKYNLIIYNKKIQKKLSIYLEDYKKESGKYKIGKKIGKGIIYELFELSTNIKIFEGEYLNGKKHGKGKEYNNKGKIKFEGEYLNGEKNGKGKEYEDC